jgi:hypothetical protein
VFDRFWGGSWWTAEVTTWSASTGSLGFHYLKYASSWDSTFSIHNPTEMMKIRYHKKGSALNASEVSPEREFLNFDRR